MEKPKFTPPQEKVHDLAEPEAGGSRSVLLLDDLEDFAEVMREFLGSQGFVVATARNGSEGLRKVMAQDFDVILCDMVMPQIAGDMFYRAVDRVKPHLLPRFIFMTGHKGDPKIDEFIRSIKGLILWKPFQTHQLLQAIEVIEKKRLK